MKKLLFFFRYSLSAVLILVFSGCQPQRLYKDSRAMMGTFVEVISPDKEAAGIVFDEVRRIENLLSKYKKDSEVSRLNENGSLAVSKDTFDIIERTREFCLISEGVFDITVGPLIDLWGFTDKHYFFPSDTEIKKALKLVGTDKIIIDRSESTVIFRIPGMKIDLGAVAKGYAVDCAVKRLRENGVKSCLINAGGDIYCLGGRQPHKAWKVAVQNPRGNNFSGYLRLEDRAVATSGDYEQFFLNDGKRYSHIINPKTGYPSDSGIISVTVIASDCLTADFLATAVFILGKEKGLGLAESFKGAEIKIIEEKNPLLYNDGYRGGVNTYINSPCAGDCFQAGYYG